MWESLIMREPMSRRTAECIQPGGVSTDTQDLVQPYHYSHRQHQKKLQGHERQQKVEIPCHRGAYSYAPEHEIHDNRSL
ncbi:hypothetical protein CDAR_260131 [Caerostris darwini]|uniref:Uncharacterized protein n=1 Tax=Caerostris darwini TaxID=1538125 RepID=A0AAV4VBA7_9ARAC|nr:hypothetical protein CDAR_260131 [Caerostris darwini]